MVDTARVTIMLVIVEGMELYEGTVRDARDEVLFTVRRWSENAVRTALMRYLFQTRNALTMDPAPAASEALEQLRNRASGGK